MLDGGKEGYASTETLTSTFWKVNKKLENVLLIKFEAQWKDQKVEFLVPLMDELIHYYSLCQEAEWIDEKDIVIKAMQCVVLRLINTILAQKQKDLKLCQDGVWYEQSEAFSPFD